eukprot:gb/GECG01008483.1/.p1 GENE.gb/GECG01008483.1/~~gb/GECG01008483.1/.p1  ORF type:complete len:109 (+),score=12.39 gb/GECG01008483.1/:1-327(+)
MLMGDRLRCPSWVHHSGHLVCAPIIGVLQMFWRPSWVPQTKAPVEQHYQEEEYCHEGLQSKKNDYSIADEVPTEGLDEDIPGPTYTLATCDFIQLSYLNQRRLEKGLI